MTTAAEQSGWLIVAHPLFIDQLESLVITVEQLRAQNPDNYQQKNATKRLYAILKLIEVIPQDPTRPIYRQGNTLGKQHRQWFRAKFFQQYRLFFRYSLQQKIIILGKCCGVGHLPMIGMRCWRKHRQQQNGLEGCYRPIHNPHLTYPIALYKLILCLLNHLLYNCNCLLMS